MVKQNQVAVTSQVKYLQNINNPIGNDFKLDVLKMNTTDLVDFILESKPTSIYKLYKDNEEKTADVIMLMLIQFQDFYNCKNKMDKMQLTETAYIIIQQFRHFNYYDIGLALKTAKLNDKIYDRIDGGMILEWLTRHDIVRTGMIVIKREQQNNEYKSNWGQLAEKTSIQKLKEFLK